MSSLQVQDLPAASPRLDGGKNAWMVLAACSLIQIPVWGFPLSFGVFQNYFAEHELKLSISSIAVIGTTSSGILYLSSPVTFAILSQHPGARRLSGSIGLVLALIGFILSSFTASFVGYVITLGVVSTVGTGLLFTTTTLYLDEWWQKRRSLAYGIMWSAKSFAGVALPLVADVSLKHFGPRVVLRAWTICVAVISIPVLFLVKSPETRPVPAASRALDLKFLREMPFWMFQTGNVIQSFGYFLPTAYLASYAHDIGLSDLAGTILLSVLNGTSIFGSLAVGLLSNHIEATTTIIICTIGSATAVLLFWGLSGQLAMLSLFAIIYGFFAGSFSTTWSGIQTEIKRQSPTSNTGFVFGLLAGGRGIGNVLSGPLSVALMKASRKHERATMGYDTDFGSVIVFTGVTAILGGWGWAWHTCTKRRGLE